MTSVESAAYGTPATDSVEKVASAPEKGAAAYPVNMEHAAAPATEQEPVEHKEVMIKEPRFLAKVSSWFSPQKPSSEKKALTSGDSAAGMGGGVQVVYSRASRSCDTAAATDAEKGEPQAESQGHAQAEIPAETQVAPVAGDTLAMNTAEVVLALPEQAPPALKPEASGPAFKLFGMGVGKIKVPWDRSSPPYKAKASAQEEGSVEALGAAIERNHQETAALEKQLEEKRTELRMLTEQKEAAVKKEAEARAEKAAKESAAKEEAADRETKDVAAAVAAAAIAAGLASAQEAEVTPSSPPCSPPGATDGTEEATEEAASKVHSRPVRISLPGASATRGAISAI